MRSCHWAMVAVIAVVIGTATTAWGHQTDQSEQVTEVRAHSGEVEQLFSISVTDLAHHLGYIGHGEEASAEVLEAMRTELKEYLREHTGVAADGALCDLVEAEFVAYPAMDGRVHYHQQWQCPVRPSEVKLENRVMVDGHDGYRHTARVQVGEAIHPTVFDASFPTYTVYPKLDEGEEATPQPRWSEASALDRFVERMRGLLRRVIDGVVFW